MDARPDVQRLLEFLTNSFPIEAIDTDPSLVWLPQVDRGALEGSADDP